MSFLLGMVAGQILAIAIIWLVIDAPWYQVTAEKGQD